MAKIYKDFKELTKQNKSIFKLFKGSKNHGILKAIWDSRQAEVETLKAENERLRKENQSFEPYMEKAKEAVESLKTEMKNLSDSNHKLSEIIKIQNGQLEKKTDYIGSLEFLKNSNEIKLKDLGSLKDDLDNKFKRISNSKSGLEGMLKLRDQEIIELTAELEELKKYAKQYKMINNKLSLELDKVTRELEQFYKRPVSQNI